ncbi:MAG: hypothetical protein ACON42_00385 [Flavobacteriaceae bacterium]
MTYFFRVLALLCIAQWGYAQSSSASPYSYNGMGDLNFRGNQFNRHMSGLEVYNDSIHVSLSNPTSYARLKRTTYSLGIHYKSTNLESADETQNIPSGTIDYLGIGIPVGPFGFGFGILPYSSVGYRVQDIIEADNDGNVERVDRFQGEGGINKAFLSIGFPLFKYFALGATVNYDFGRISLRNSQFLESVDLGTFLDKNASVSGLTYQLAADLKIPLGKKIFTELYASYYPEATLISTNSAVYYTSSLSGNNSGDFEEVDLAASGQDKTDIRMPSLMKFGGGIGQEKKWFLGFQYEQTASSNFSNPFMQLPSLSYEDGTRMIIGGFYIPRYTSLTSFWKRVVYRFGVRQETTGLIAQGESVNDFGMSFGLGIPLNGFSNANIGLELGQRGDTDNGRILENYWAVRVGFSLNDLWFIKRKYN